MRVILDFTTISIILSFISLFLQNNILHFASFILLIVVSIMGNILVYNHSTEFSHYYEMSKKWVYIFNILNHIILPIILLYYLYNKLILLSFEDLTNIRINTFIFIIILATVYHILMKLNITGSYGIPYYKSLQYSFISTIIVIIILCNLHHIFKNTKFDYNN